MPTAVNVGFGGGPGLVSWMRRERKIPSIDWLAAVGEQLHEFRSIPEALPDPSTSRSYRHLVPATLPQHLTSFVQAAGLQF